MARKRTGSIQKRGDAYRISYYSDGIRQFETITGTLEEAQSTLNIRLGEIAKGLPVSSKFNTILFEELAADVINDYKVRGLSSLEDINTRLRLHILPFFGTKKAAQITSAHVKAYIVKRREETPTPKNGTINRELEAIRRVFNLALAERRILVKPKITLLPEHNARTGFFTREEVDSLCSHIKKQVIADFILFGFLTGWRYDEIRNLQWSNVDFQAGEIRLDGGLTTKNRDGRVFPMTQELRRLLESRAAAERARRTPRAVKQVTAISAFRDELQGPVFILRGRKIGHFRKTWATACHKAGFSIVDIKGKPIKITRTFHDLRRSFARDMDRKGVRQGAVMKLGGWKTDSVYRRYNIVSEADLRDAIELVDGIKHPDAPKADEK